MVWHNAPRSLVERVPVTQRDQFRVEHLSEVASLASADGLWLDVSMLFARGYKPVRGAAIEAR